MIHLMSQSKIESMNEAARAYAADTRLLLVDAYRKVADANNLEWVNSAEFDGTTNDPSTMIYRDEDGAFVALWVEGAELGFDDQVTDEEVERIA